MAKGKAKALKNSAAKGKKSRDTKSSAQQDVAEEQQLGSAGDAQQHLTATHQAVVGLSNLGNTCFFNSSVQLLLSCAPLQQMLAQKDHDISRGPLGFALQQATVHAAGRSSTSKGGSNSTYNPQSLLSAVCCHAPVFKGKQQHDAHELMRMLLDGLQTQEQRYKDLSRRGPGKGLPALTNGTAALANGHAHGHARKQGDQDLSTTSSSSSSSSDSSSTDSSSAGSSGQVWSAANPASTDMKAQQQNGTLLKNSKDVLNGMAEGTPAGTASSSSSSSMSPDSSSSSEAEADDTAASGAYGTEALCDADLSKPRPTVDSRSEGDPAAAGIGPAAAAASPGSEAASSTAAEGGSINSSSSNSEASVAPPPAGPDTVIDGNAAADSPAQLPAQANSTAVSVEAPAANGILSSSGACAVCGCGLQQQQQGAPNPLQRKSLLPPVPPTSAGSSSVEAVFGGVLSSCITCTACGYCSISYEPFLDLSLPIPLGNGPEQGLLRKGSLLSRLANRAAGKKKGAAAKDAAADGSTDGSNTSGTDAAAAVAAAEAAAEAAAAATAAAAAAVAQGKKKVNHKEKRRLQQVANAAVKEANKLARLAKKKRQEQEDASGSGRADAQQQSAAAAAAAVVDPTLFEDILATNYYTQEQIELSDTLRASAESFQDHHQQQQQQQQWEDQQSVFMQDTHDQQGALAEPAQQQQSSVGDAADVGGVSPVSAGGCSPAVSLTRVTAASDEGASSTSGLTDVGGASGSPPTAAVSCWGGTWGDMRDSQRSPAPPSSTSSTHLQPPSSSSGFPPSVSDAGVPAGGSDGSSTSPKGAAPQPGAPKTLHKRFGSLGSLSALTSGAKGGLTSLFTGRHSRQGSKDKDSLDKLAAAELNGSANGGTVGVQRSQSAGLTSPSSGRGGLKGFLLNRATTPPPPRPSSALGVVNEAGEGSGGGGLTGRISIPEDSPVDPVGQELPQQHNMQLLGSGAVFTPLGVLGDVSVSSTGPEAAAAPAAAANGAVADNGSSRGHVAANGLQPAAAAAGGTAAVLAGGQQQLPSRRLQRAFSDDAVVLLGRMRRSNSSSNSSGGGSSAGEQQQQQQQQQQQLVPAGGSRNGLLSPAAANGDASVGILPAGRSSGAYINPFAAPSIQQQQQGAAGDTSPEAQGNGPAPAAAVPAVPVAPGQDPFAAAAVVGKGEALAVQHCLATFYLREDVSWECPKEKAVLKERRLSAASGRVSMDGSARRSTDGGSGAGAAGAGVCATCSQRQQQGEGSGGGGGVAIAAHPRLQQLLEEGDEGEGPAFKQVSFSERQPQVHFVPGSVEQRGTDLEAALAGRRPFCRALSWCGASLLLTAQLGEVFLAGADAGRQLMLGIKAAGEGGVANAPAARVLPGGSMQLGAVRLPDVQDLCLSGDDSAALLQHWAQLVLNCMADLVHCEGGISGLQAMAAGGLSLMPVDSPRQALRRGYVDAGSLEGQWKVRGQLPPATSAAAAGTAGGDADAAGDAAQEALQQQQQGYWEYPAGEVDDADDAAAAAAASCADGVDAGSAGAGSVQAADSSCLSPAPSSASAVGSSPGAATAAAAGDSSTGSMQASLQVQTAAAATARAEVGDDMFAMDEEGQNEAGSEQQEQGPHGQQTQGWQGDALSSASSSTLGGKALRSGSCSLGSRDGEEGRTSTSRSVSLFRKVPLSPSTSAVAGEADADVHGGTNGAVAMQPPAAAAVAAVAAAAVSSQPVNIQPLQGSPPAGVGLSPVVCGSSGRTPLGGSGSPRRSSLRRRSSSCSRTAHKSYRIYLPPQVLLLHLKRFQHDGRGRLNKLDTAVKFEFELDLSPFMAENAPSTSSSSNEAHATQQQQQQLMYDLVGLVVHMGTMRGGHYVAYVKRVHGAEGSEEAGAAASSTGSQGRVQWYYISDTSVRAVGVAEVAAAQAYMLLYVRRPAKEQQEQQGEQGQEVPEAHLHDCGL